MTASLSIGILFEHSHVTQSQPAGIIAALRARGHRVTLLDPQSFSYQMGNRSWLGKFDLTIARGQSLGLQYLLAWAKWQGLSTINQHAAMASAHNAAEIPTIHIDKTSNPVNVLSCQAHDSCYTLIFNPTICADRNELHVIYYPDEMAGSQFSEATTPVHQYLPSDGCDLKLYGVNDRIWVVRNPSSFYSSTAISSPNY